MKSFVVLWWSLLWVCVLGACGSTASGGRQTAGDGAVVAMDGGVGVDGGRRDGAIPVDGVVAIADGGRQNHQPEPMPADFARCTLQEARPGQSFRPSRLVRPRAATILGGLHATLHWSPGEGAMRTHIEVCRDRGCTQVVQQADVEGDTWRTPETLAAGLYYWRTVSISPDGQRSAPSCTWHFAINGIAAQEGRELRELVDINGDGLGDVVSFGYQHLEDRDVASDRMAVTFGTERGYRLDDQPDQLFMFYLFLERATSVILGSLSPAGDLNGDGYGDVAVSVSEPTMSGLRGRVYWGSPTGLHWYGTAAPAGFALRSIPLSENQISPGSHYLDINRDGFGDVVFSRVVRGENGALGAGCEIVTLTGRPGGLGPVERASFRLDSGESHCRLFYMGDVDGDDLVDFSVRMGTTNEGPLYLLGRMSNPPYFAEPRLIEPREVTNQITSRHWFQPCQLSEGPDREFISARGTFVVDAAEPTRFRWNRAYREVPTGRALNGIEQAFCEQSAADGRMVGYVRGIVDWIWLMEGVSSAEVRFRRLEPFFDWGVASYPRYLTFFPSYRTPLLDVSGAGTSVLDGWQRLEWGNPLIHLEPLFLGVSEMRPYPITSINQTR